MCDGLFFLLPCVRNAFIGHFFIKWVLTFFLKHLDKKHFYPFKFIAGFSISEGKPKLQAAFLMQNWNKLLFFDCFLIKNKQIRSNLLIFIK